jgi:hypothetical protein
MARRAVLTATSGPNEGDTISIEIGSCRLIGRHLSENETALIGKDGNRLLDGPANDVLSKHLKTRAPGTPGGAARISAESFERGPDVIFADDSISRAHAMVFFDPKGLGLIDLASTNGTFVNNERVTSAMVGDGDTLTIGNSELVVKMR